MKIALLSRRKGIYSTQRIAQAGARRGHEMRIIDPLKCYMNISSRSPSIHLRGHRLEGFDAVIPRIGASITFYGAAVVRQFEMMGVYSLNESQAISRSRDKLRSLQLLAREGVGLPVTGFAHDIEDSDDLLKVVGGAPVIIKLLEGTQGMGVVLAETQKACKSVIDAFRELKAHFLVQQYVVAESPGQDIRCFVIGDEVVASMRRQAKEGEFRSNLHRGAYAESIEITPEERMMAVRATHIIGLNMAGVDLIRSHNGPLILEVNSSPGLEGIEKCTELDIASLIIKFLEKNAAYGHTRTRGKG